MGKSQAMEEIVNAISNRIKTPYFGYSILAFFALNWRGLFLLVLTEGTPQHKLAAFDQVTNIQSLIIFPLLIGSIIALSAPWLRYLFELLSTKPFALVDELKLSSLHTITIKQKELEQSRADLFALKENELIERAERDEKVKQFANSDEKKKLENELEKLRKERNSLYAQPAPNFPPFGADTDFTVASLDKKDPSTTLKLLSKNAIELLKTSAQSISEIIIITHSTKQWVKIGEHSFGEKNNQTFLSYKNALEELLHYDLIKQTSSNEKRFGLSDKGWELTRLLI